MPSISLSNTPTAVTGMTVDVNYTIQFQANTKSYLQLSTSVPTDANDAFVADPMEKAIVKRTGSQNFYVWQPKSDFGYGKLVYEQVNE